MYNFGLRDKSSRVKSFLAAVAIVFIAVLGATRAQAQDDGNRNPHTNGGGGNHHHKQKAATGADPFWDINGTTAGSGGGAAPSGTWSTSVAFWNPVAGGTGTTAVWNNGDAAVFSAGTNATGSYTVTVSGTVTASSITFEEGTVTLAGTATPVLTIGAGGVTIDNTINGTTTFGSTLGTIIASADQAWTNNSTQGFTVSSGVQLGDKVTLTLGGSGSGTISGIISQVANNGVHQGALVKTGAGTFTLTGANSYGGGTNGTTVSAGTLLVNNLTGSGTGAGAVVVNGTGTLGGSGTISGTVTASGSTAIINPGATAGAIGTLSTGALTMNTSSIFSVDMTATTADQINVTGAVSLSTALLQLNIPNGTTFAANQQFLLINNDSTDLISGTFSNAPTGTDIINGYAWVVTYTGGTNGNDFVLTAVPETSTWLAGCLALGALICSQRRRIRLLLHRSVRA
jgi:fibronectin-binding autotransporter adhesin